MGFSVLSPEMAKPAGMVTGLIAGSSSSELNFFDFLLTVHVTEVKAWGETLPHGLFRSPHRPQWTIPLTP